MNREEYKKEAKSTIDEVFNQINELEAKKENAKEEVKASYNEKLAELKAKRDEMKTKDEDLLTSSEDKWEEVRDTFDSASNSFNQGFSELTTLVK